MEDPKKKSSRPSKGNNSGVKVGEMVHGKIPLLKKVTPSPLLIQGSSLSSSSSSSEDDENIVIPESEEEEEEEQKAIPVEVEGRVETRTTTTTVPVAKWLIENPRVRALLQQIDPEFPKKKAEAEEPNAPILQNGIQIKEEKLDKEEEEEEMVQEVVVDLSIPPEEKMQIVLYQYKNRNTSTDSTTSNNKFGKRIRVGKPYLRNEFKGNDTSNNCVFGMRWDNYLSQPSPWIKLSDMEKRTDDDKGIFQVHQQETDEEPDKPYDLSK